MKVLLVDDDSLMLDTLCRILDWEGLGARIVGTAENGEKALELAQANKPDVVIADISMPVMDGLALTRQLRDRFDGVKIFLISGHDDFEYARKALQYGVENYILKPINRETVRSLEVDLKKIQSGLEIQKEHYLNFWNNAEDEAILLALEQGNGAFFDSLFSDITRKCEASPDITVTCCLKLLRILYRYFERIQMEREAIERSRRNSCEEILEINGRNEKLDFVFQRYFDVLDAAGRFIGGNTQSIVCCVKKLVKENFTNSELCFSWLSDRVGCTPGYLSTVFRQAVGVNLSTYIMNLRIDYAKKLLGDLSNSIADISQAVGFSNPHYFTRIFKKKTNLTPSEFRNLAVQSTAIL